MLIKQKKDQSQENAPLLFYSMDIYVKKKQNGRWNENPNAICSSGEFSAGVVFCDVSDKLNQNNSNNDGLFDTSADEAGRENQDTDLCT
jgi:hypothetical protein